MPPPATPPLQQEVAPFNEYWWRLPIRQWPSHKRRTDIEYYSLFPPCWEEVNAGGEKGHDWTHCAQCEAMFPKWNGESFLPSRWVCRCGLHNDLKWRHQEKPHKDCFCDPCGKLMAADDIDMGKWCSMVAEWKARWCEME